MNQRLRAQGARAADLQERGGEASLQQMEADRQATLLGISMGESAGANEAYQQSIANQMAAAGANVDIETAAAANWSEMMGTGMEMMGEADWEEAGSRLGGKKKDKNKKQN